MDIAWINVERDEGKWRLVKSLLEKLKNRKVNTYVEVKEKLVQKKRCVS